MLLKYNLKNIIFVKCKKKKINVFIKNLFNQNHIWIIIVVYFNTKQNKVQKF